MEELQGHINPFFFGEQMTLGCFEEEGDVRRNAARADLDFDNGYGTYIINSNQDDEQEEMPFLHMLLEQETPQPSFQFLLRLQELQHQQLRPRNMHWTTAEKDFRHIVVPSSLELESCVTHASESQSENRDRPASCCNPELTTTATNETWLSAGPPARERNEKRKRKRCRPSKNADEVESQRMTHIAVERNRRKLMNDHLNSLRSLMPSSFVPRNDQATIVGGAIDFVKELEQLLQSLEAEQRKRTLRSRSGVERPNTSPFRGFFTSPQYTTYTIPPVLSASSSTATPSSPSSSAGIKVEEEVSGWTGVVADVEATVVQAHVNLKVLSPRRPRQLVRAITALEELHLAVLHLNVTSSDDSVLYSFNLKMEEGCKLGSADEIATAVHHIFS